MPTSNTTPHPLTPEVQQALAQILQAQKQWEQKLRISGLTQRQIWFLGQMCRCRHQLWATLDIEEANAITPH
jgi:hypothetical protein